MGGDRGSVAADCPPLFTQVAVGWGDLAVLQVVADLSPPSYNPPVVGGGGGTRGCTANQTFTHREPQPIATKVGWGRRRLAGDDEGWLGTTKVGWGRRRLAGDVEGWLGTTKVGWGRRRSAGDDKGWLGAEVGWGRSINSGLRYLYEYR